MSRFTPIPTMTYEETESYVKNLWVNPFQIESFYEIEISYTDDDGNDVQCDGVRVLTKAGDEWDAMLSIDEFLKIVS
jgi:hypothetical protein